MLAATSSRPHDADGSKGGGEEALRVVGLNRDGVIRNVSFTLRKGEISRLRRADGRPAVRKSRARSSAPIRSTAARYTSMVKSGAIASPADAVRNGVAYLSEDRKRSVSVTHDSRRCPKRHHGLDGPRFTSAKVFMRDEARLRKTPARYVNLLKVKTPSVDQETRLLSGGNSAEVVISKMADLRDCGILFLRRNRRAASTSAAKAEIYKLLSKGLRPTKGKARRRHYSSELPEGACVFPIASCDVARVAHRRTRTW